MDTTAKSCFWCEKPLPEKRSPLMKFHPKCRDRYWNKRDALKPEWKEKLKKHNQTLWLDAGYRERYSIRKKLYRAGFRKTVIEHYGSRCQCCEESRYEFLTIDHIDGGGSAHRKEATGHVSGGGSSFHRWIIKNNFPPTLRVLCYNCNCSRRSYDKCPHEKERETPGLQYEDFFLNVPPDISWSLS